MHRPYEPTPEEIRCRREQIRAGWSEATRIQRSGYRKEVPKIKVCSTELFIPNKEMDSWLTLTDEEAVKNQPPVKAEDLPFSSENFEDEELDLDAEYVHTFGDISF